MLFLCRKLLYSHNICFLSFEITSVSYEVILKLIPFHTLSEQLVHDGSSNRNLRRLTISQSASQCIMARNVGQHGGFLCLSSALNSGFTLSMHSNQMFCGISLTSAISI